MEVGLGSDSAHQYPSMDVLITGRSGTSKSILVNGIFGKEVVKERHGVVNVARSSAIDLYSHSIDGVQVNVLVSSRFQDGDVTNEAEYLQELNKLCSGVDLILYCLKMTETRFVLGNPDAQAMAKITQMLGRLLKTHFPTKPAYCRVTSTLMSFQLAIIDNPTYLTVSTGCGQNAKILFPVLLHVKHSIKSMQQDFEK